MNGIQAMLKGEDEKKKDLAKILVGYLSSNIAKWFRVDDWNRFNFYITYITS